MHWYARWGLTRQGRAHELVRCTLCVAVDHRIEPCLTCRSEGRAGVVQEEWASYARLAGLHRSYAETDTGPPVPCGDQNCQGSLALSAVDEGVRL